MYMAALGEFGSGFWPSSLPDFRAMSLTLSPVEWLPLWLLISLGSRMCSKQGEVSWGRGCLCLPALTSKDLYHTLSWLPDHGRFWLTRLSSLIPCIVYCSWYFELRTGLCINEQNTFWPMRCHWSWFLFLVITPPSQAFIALCWTWTRPGYAHNPSQSFQSLVVFQDPALHAENK